MSRKIDVIEETVSVLADIKTQQLIKVIDDQQKSLFKLRLSLLEYQDWLEEELVRLQGEA